ncbi:MAG: peptidylprolyl isomerase [Actinomycetota bacterium]
MARSKTRERQLRRLSERRASARARIRRRKIIAIAVAGFLLIGGTAAGLVAVLSGGDAAERPNDEQPEAAPSPEGAACGADLKEFTEERPMYDSPPEMQIDSKKDYRAIMETSCGRVVLELFAAEAPITVNNFVFLAREGFYDGLTFQRIVPGFVIQGGDPLGTGSGGPGYQFEDEISKGLTFDEPGLLAMANSGSDTNGSQFFITLDKPAHLNGLHTIFGRVVEGMDVVQTISELETVSERPVQVVYIDSITIQEK